jgi:hypothetical protein
MLRESLFHYPDYTSIPPPGRNSPTTAKSSVTGRLSVVCDLGAQSVSQSGHLPRTFP